MTTLLTLAAIFATLALIAIAGVTILNVLTFPRLDEAPEPTTFPLVSVLIPARNEAEVIGVTVRRLLDQDYPALEVLVLDDGSTDGTAEIARAAVGDDARLRVPHGGHGEDTGPSSKRLRVPHGGHGEDTGPSPKRLRVPHGGHGGDTGPSSKKLRVPHGGHGEDTGPSSKKIRVLHGGHGGDTGPSSKRLRVPHGGHGGDTDPSSKRLRVPHGGHGEDTGPSSKRLRVLTGQPLPEGWLGKSWACHQLAQAAQGEILLFTDADVSWTPGALRRLVGEMEARGADLQTVWPTQITKTWTERLVVPLMAFVIVGYLPLLAVHHIPWPVFAAAMGQCLAFRRDAYARVGGHAAVRDEIVEDVAFAKAIKRAARRLRVADGGGVICCRMYHNWNEVRNGFAKNILAGHGDSVAFLLLSWAFHWLLFLLPWLWLALGWLGGPPGWPHWPLALIGLGIGVRALTAAFSRQRVRDAIWLPVSTLLMAVIAAQSIWWRVRYGGPRWKGRTFKKRKT